MMTEQLGHKESHEKKNFPEKHAEVSKSHESEHQHESKQFQERHFDKKELEKLAKHVAKSSEETPIEKQETKSDEPWLGVYREAKNQTYERMLKKIRPHLSPAERTFSKIIHQPAVEIVSEIGSKTLARPSGILGGGILALVGGSVVLYVSKYFGFEYNFFVYLFFLLIGFLGGVSLEMLISGMRPRAK